MQEKEIFLKGKKLFYRSAGSGQIIVLLHGFGEDSTIWKNQFDVFTGYHLLIPDLPGSGQSEMIDDMSMEGLAEAVKE
ncbi:MAG: alpha/beta fold hydrolase, partial [Flavisolibacter sp.]